MLGLELDLVDGLLFLLICIIIDVMHGLGLGNGVLYCIDGVILGVVDHVETVHHGLIGLTFDVCLALV